MPRIFAQLPNVDFCVPVKPHVDFKEGGHLFIEPADKNISERYEMTPEQLTDLAFGTQLLGYAMWQVLPEHGIDLYRINYQDNGNWSFLRGEERPMMHVHLYGRTTGEQKQSYGQALAFPDPGDSYYDDIVPVPDKVLHELCMCMKEILNEHMLDIPFEGDQLMFVLDTCTEC